MNYKENIEKFSEAIFNFDKKSQIGETTDYSDNIRVYRQNLFYGVYRRITEDYPVTYIHAEENNFKFLIQKFLIDSKISFTSVFDYSKFFSVFLGKVFYFHQDSLLVELSKIDILYKYGEYNGSDQLQTFKGVFKYWSDCLQAKEGDELGFEIDVNKYELLNILRINNEKYIKKVKDEIN